MLLPKCSVCSEEYHHDAVNNKQPPVLRCGHSFCAGCVRGLLDNSRHHTIECPACRRATVEADVQINYGLSDVVQQMREALAANGDTTTTANNNTTHPASGQPAPLTDRQRQEEADYLMAVRLSQEINGEVHANALSTGQGDTVAVRYLVSGGCSAAAPSECRTGTTPSVRSHEVVSEGTGRLPTVGQQVLYDITVWNDGFDTTNKAYDIPGLIHRVSPRERDGWWYEALLSMKEGEVRRIIVHTDASDQQYVQLRLICIIPECWPENEDEETQQTSVDGDDEAESDADDGDDLLEISIEYDDNNGGHDTHQTSAGTAASPQATNSSSPAIGAHRPQQTSDGFSVSPMGVRYRITREGTGRVPTLDQRVKYDFAIVEDESAQFDGGDEADELNGAVIRLSAVRDWFDEALLSMRDGEVRHIIDPHGGYVQLRLIGILDG